MGFSENVAAMGKLLGDRATKRSDFIKSLSDDSEFDKMAADDPVPAPSTQAPVDVATGQPGEVPGAPVAMMPPGKMPAHAAVGRAIGQQPTAVPKGNLHQWITEALGQLHLDPSYEPGLASLIQHESGGNPNSINLTDSNAIAGHPSQGLMQTIPGTFKQYMLPGHGNITNPVDNIIAGTRYALRNYGAGMIKAGGRHNSKGAYIGY